jgi:TRAP-type C4-dicarboxylate transport system permease large subunit
MAEDALARVSPRTRTTAVSHAQPADALAIAAALCRVARHAVIAVAASAVRTAADGATAPNTPPCIVTILIAAR